MPKTIHSATHGTAHGQVSIISAPAGVAHAGGRAGGAAKPDWAFFYSIAMKSFWLFSAALVTESIRRML